MLLSNLKHDLKVGWRQMVRHPLASFAAILMFALGIGLNTANFSVVNAFLLAPLPFERPDELVHLYRTDDQNGDDRLGFSWPLFHDLAEESSLFSEIGAYTYRQRILAEDGQEPEQITECRITPSLLPLLGIEPHVGTAFVDSQTLEGSHRVALIAYGLWQQSYGSDPEIVGRLLRIDGQSYEILGVMPEGFSFPFGAVKIWTPAVDDSGGARTTRNLNVVARLADGVSMVAAKDQFGRLFQQMELEYQGDESQFKSTIVPLRQALLFLFDTMQALLGLASAANLMMLFIVCSNVSILLVVRLAERRHELGVRQALGANRSRLIRQLLVEGFLLSAIGAVIGLVVASLGLTATAQTIPEELFRSGELQLDVSALVFALLMAVVTTLFFALTPALKSTKNLFDTLREAGSGSGLDTQKLRQRAIVIQILSLMVLVMGTFTLSRSFKAMQDFDTGFSSEGLLSFEIHMPEGRYKGAAELWLALDGIKEGLESTSGVRGAAYLTPLPLNFEAASRKFKVVGDTSGGKSSWRSAREHRVSLDYFSTMDIAVQRGRAFEKSDNLDSQSVVVISATMAKQLWPQEDAVDKMLTIVYAGDQRDVRIVGVVEDTSNFLLSETRQSILYLPQTQFPRRRNFFVARTEGQPLDFAGPAREIIERIDPAIGMSKIRAMDQVVEESLMPWRMAAEGMVWVAMLSMVLAAIGIYGLTAHTMITRSREFGVHMAMGANPKAITRLLLKQTLKTVAIGLVIGFALYLLLMQLLKSLIHGVSALDPLTILAATLSVVATALLASFVPIRRVKKLSLSDVLRYE